MDLWGPDWSALSSASALMVLVARRDGSPLQQSQRERIVWELEKYGPCYCEARGAQLLPKGEAAALSALEAAADLNALGDAMIAHGTRVLRPRDRETLRWVIGAGVRTAAMERPLDASDISVLHHVWTRSKGEMAVDGQFGSVELGAQDAMRASHDDMLTALLAPTSPLDTRRRIYELAARPTYSAGWDARRAFAFLIHASAVIDGSPITPVELGQITSKVAAESGLDRPPNAQECTEAISTFEACSPNDRFVFFTHFEDQLALFLDRTQTHQNGLLRAINAVAKSFGEVTATRQEMVTLAMAVLAQGRSAQWRARALPPASLLVANAGPAEPEDPVGNRWTR